MSKTLGKIFVLVAPSGTGKSTLMKMIKKDFADLKESISYTTRSPREGEVHGTHYFFVTPDEFKNKLDSGDFLEWAEVHGNFYGTSKEFVLSIIENGQNMIFDIDVQGADQLKNHFKDQARVIFVSPPSLEELEKRLRGRGTDSAEVIEIRLKNAASEIKRQNDYDFLVINDSIEKAYSKIKDIISSESGGECKTK